MKKTLPRLSLARETLRRLDPTHLHQAAGGAVTRTETDFTSDITNCYICPVYPITTDAGNQ